MVFDRDTGNRDVQNEKRHSRYWLDSQFKNSNNLPLPCFWCGTMLTRLTCTADHIVPSYMKKDIEDNLVVCCCACNNERSKISTLYSRLLTTESWTRGSKTRWFQRRKETKQILHKFRELIEIKLSMEKQLICLEEINRILWTNPSFFKDKIVGFIPERKKRKKERKKRKTRCDKKVKVKVKKIKVKKVHCVDENGKCTKCKGKRGTVDKNGKWRICMVCFTYD